MTAYDTVHRAIVGGAADRPASQTVPRWTTAALCDVVTGRSAVSAVRHPLGFTCLPLERTGERGVCVHLWTDRLVQATPTTTTTHSHSWDLLSFVLYGTLCNELVEVDEYPAGAAYRVFEVGSGPDGDQIRRTDRLVRRRTTARETHRGGEVYALPAGIFHETVTSGETATVALGCGRPGAVDLVLGAVETVTHRVRRQLCDREETVRAATLVVQRLADPRCEGRCE